MLTFKRGIQDVKLQEQEQSSLPMQELVGKTHDELFKLFQELNSEDTADPKVKWKKTLQIIEKPGEGIGCEIMQRPIPGRNVNMCKNVSVFRGISIEAWLEYSLNFLAYMGDDP